MDRTFSVTRRFTCPVEVLRNCLWNIQSWIQFWVPLQQAEILYDDGRHQDFLLELDWNGSRIWMRTVRFLMENGDIHFFSPQPPPPMTYHRGIWRFLPQGSSVVLEAIRTFSPECSGFQDRLSLLLEKIGEACEK